MNSARSVKMIEVLTDLLSSVFALLDSLSFSSCAMQTSVCWTIVRLLCLEPQKGQWTYSVALWERRDMAEGRLVLVWDWDGETRQARGVCDFSGCMARGEEGVGDSLSNSKLTQGG